MLGTPCPTSRRGKLAAASSSSPPASHRQASIAHQQAKLGDGRPPFCAPTSTHCKLSAPQPTSAKPCLSSDRAMASSDAAMPSSSLKKKPNPASPSPRINGDGAKSAGPPPRRRPAASAPPPKKAIRDATPASGRRRASQAPIEGKQGSRDSGQLRVQLHGQPANKIHREKIAMKGRRGGCHISDLPSRRRALTCPQREIQLRRCSFDDAATGFPLLNLEEYLKQRAWYPKHAAQTADEMGSPGSLLTSMQKQNLMLRKQMSVLLDESAPQLAGIGVKDPRLLAKFSVHTYVSDHEADDVGNWLNSDKSGYSRSLNQPATHRSSRSEGLLHYAGSCFNVSTRRTEGRRRHIAYMYNSERSMSSFGSETEMAPLMTEPEPFHDFSDDQSASSAELDQPQGHYNVGELTYNKYKGICSQDCEPALDVYKDIHEHENSYEVQGLALKRQRDMACKHRSISQKYRPNSFNDILGQKMVAESLSNAILRSKIAPVYLFYGPRGTGKTTAAKIFTCAMNCLSVEELRPCGLCKECISFNAGTNYDTKELDAAGNNEIGSMKAMLKHLCLPPSVSRYKVFIMDDCHMLTSEAWNALLKSLEEPPDYVVFILITTNLEQVPRAAVSRCQKFMFSRVKDADIVFRLRKLAQLEKVEIDMDALHFIASQSDGSLRDAEMMLDQLSLLGKKVTLGIVREMVGLIPEDDLINLLEMALSMDTVNTVNTIRELMGSGVDPLVLTSQLAMLITDILAGRCPVTRYTGMKVRKDQQDKLQHALKVLSDSEKQLRSCSDRTTWFTAAFLQLSTSSNFHPSSTQATSAAQSPALLADASVKEAPNRDGAGQRYSKGGKEKWDEYYPSQGDNMQENSLCESSSGPFMDIKIHPCDQSPQSGTSNEEKIVCKSQCRTTQDVNDNACGAFSPRSMNEVWQKVLRGNSSKVLKQLLQGQAKLVSISLAEGFALAHLEFRSPEHKSMAERAKEKISSAFQVALLCPVKVEISLSSSQGRGDFADRGADHVNQIHTEHHNRHMPLEHENVRGSFRKSSVRNRDFTALSPMHHELEHRKSLQSIDGDVSSNTKMNTDRSCQDLQVCRGTRDHISYEHDAGYVSKHQASKEPISFHDPRFSASLRWSDTKDDMEYSSDSENDVRYAPGLLCWKGTRIKDGRGKSNIIRRRRVRFLLRLVPCGKDEGEEDKKMRTIAEI